MSRIAIARPAHGISLNAGHPQYLCDHRGRPLLFDDEMAAREHLYKFDIDDGDVDDLLIEFVVYESKQAA